MKGLIEISGDWQDAYATAYIHHKYTDKLKPNYIDHKAVMDDGYDYILLVGEYKNLRIVLANSPEYENRSFMFVHITNPTQLFDIDKVHCNVPIEISRTHNLFGWLLHFLHLGMAKFKCFFDKL